MSRKSRMAEIEQLHGKPVREVLELEYKRHGSQTKVAKALGIGQATLSIWLLKLGLREKTVLEVIEDELIAGRIVSQTRPDGQIGFAIAADQEMHS